MLQTRLITTGDELMALARPWNQAVYSQSETDMPFFSWDWFYQSYRHYGEPAGESPVVIAVEDGDRLLGILPLVTGSRKSAGIAYRTLEFCNIGASPRNSALVFSDSGHTEIFRAMFDCLFARRDLWSMIELTNVPENLPFHRYCTEEKIYDAAAMIRWKGFVTPYFEAGENLDDFFASLGRGTRRDLKRRLGKYKDSGNTRGVRFYSTPEERDEALELFFEVHRRSWKGEFQNPHTPIFYRDLYDALSPEGRVMVPVVSVDDRPIAAGFLLVNDHCFYSLINDHDAAYRDLVPGLILFIHEVDHLIKSGRKRFDFCGTAYDYKEKLADERLLHSTFQIFHRGLKSRLLFSAKTRWLPMLRKWQGRPEPDDFVSASPY